MRSMLALVLCLVTTPALQAQGPSSPPALDFEFFKSRVQPIFAAKRTGHARCVACHIGGTTLRLQPLQPGSATWSEEDSRKNFEAVTARAASAGNLQSLLLKHPLAESAGGDFYHNGGKHWTSQDDPEWRTLKAWVLGAKAGTSKVRIIQTNAAGDTVHLIDPATNTISGTITGIEAGHGAAASPDGSRIYVSNEADQTLDVVDVPTLQVIRKVGLSARPNNLAIGRDGRRVYIGIIQPPGGVDVVDTQSFERVKTVPTKGAIHNAYVTPDGKYVVAGSIQGRTINVIDTATEEPAWTLDMGLGVRPMTFSTNPDGSTKWIFVQLTELNGFAVVDFATRKEVSRVTHPALPAGRSTVPQGSDPSHGLAVTPDNKTLVVNSRLHNALYAYSLPDLKPLGQAWLTGKGAGWVTLTPDGKTAYVANPVTDDVSVVDVATLKEVTRIPVGAVPKRNVTALLQ
jgi:YVTN family beta-propeller protein